MLKEIGVLTLATVSALAAGGGVLTFAATAARPGVASLANVAPQGRLTRSPDGHYWASAEVDGAPVRFLVDTGSSAVALTAADAARLGLDTANLAYDRPVTTAGGRERAAAVVLDHVVVAGVRVEHVDALVMRSGLSASLLGMSYLGRLSRIEATPAGLVLSR